MSKQLNFGQAIKALKDGKMVARTGWNGNGMWLFLQAGSALSKCLIPAFKNMGDNVKAKLNETDGKDIVFNPNITMRTATGELQPGWNASTPDMLAEDWVIVE